MKKSFIAITCLVASFGLSKQTLAQQKKISSEDKAQIIEIFKYIDPSLYRLQFNKGTEVYGRKKFSMAQVEQIGKFRNPGSDNGYVLLVVKDDGVMIIFAATGKKVLDVLGTDKAARL